MNNVKENLLASKSFEFGVRTYRLCEQIMKTRNEFVLTRQLIRASSSVGALCSESEFAQSRPDFISELSIARKECNESRYWILMMHEVGLLDAIRAEEMEYKSNELLRILTASIKTAQSRLKN
jgi:four helix bundle protein